jgi:hypothetical protein
MQRKMGRGEGAESAYIIASRVLVDLQLRHRAVRSDEDDDRRRDDHVHRHRDQIEKTHRSDGAQGQVTHADVAAHLLASTQASGRRSAEVNALAETWHLKRSLHLTLYGVRLVHLKR